MFSVRIVTADHYLAAPIAGLDVCHSDFRGCDTKKVPVIRIFGATPAGQKTCLHLHGIFPYIYVPYDGTEPADKYMRQFASSIDRAIQVALGRGSSTAHHVFKISLVSGIPYYGYHARERDFMKIYFYNPNMVKKAVDLLLGGAVMNKAFQPYEAHVPYLLQVFMDYNLYGMNMINLGAVKFRRPEEENFSVKAELKSDQGSSQGSHGNQSLISPTTSTLRSGTSNSSSINSVSQRHWDTENLPSSQLLDQEVVRQSVCELEVDGVAADILNRSEIESNVGTNPGLVAIWEDEKQRRREQGESSQISPPLSPERDDMPLMESEEMYQQRIADIIQGYENLLQSQIDHEDSFGLSEDTLVLSHDQEDSPLSPPGGALTRTPSSFLEHHFSQIEGKETSALKEDEESEDEPVVDEDAVQNVLEVSQSFRLSQLSSPLSQRSTPQEPLLGDSQDKRLVDIMAELADESVTERSILSGLSQKMTDSEDTPEDVQRKESEVEEAEEDALMSQVWVDEDDGGGDDDDDDDDDRSQEDAISDVARRQEAGSDVEKEESEKEYDLEGMELSWNSSRLEDVIPQVDGGADDKQDNTTAPPRKTLGMTRRLVNKPKQETESAEGPPNRDDVLCNDNKKCKNTDTLSDIPGNDTPEKQYHIMESVSTTERNVSSNLCNNAMSVADSKPINTDKCMAVPEHLKQSQPTTSINETKRKNSSPTSSTFQPFSMTNTTPNYFLSTPTKDDTLSLESMLSNIRRSASKMTRTIPSLDLAPAVMSKPPINKNPHQPSCRMQQKRAKLSRRRQLNTDFQPKQGQLGVPVLNNAQPLAVPLLQTNPQQGQLQLQKPTVAQTNCVSPVAVMPTKSSRSVTSVAVKVKREAKAKVSDNESEEEEVAPTRRVTRRRNSSKLSLAATLRRRLSISSESSIDWGQWNEESDTDYHEDEDDEEDDDFVIETRTTRSRRRARRKTSDSNTGDKPYTLRTKRRKVSYNEPPSRDMTDDASVTSAKSEKSDRSSGSRKKKTKEKVPVHYIIINKFKGYKSMRVLVNRVSVSTPVKVTEELLNKIEDRLAKERDRVRPRLSEEDNTKTKPCTRKKSDSKLSKTTKPSCKSAEKESDEKKESEKAKTVKEEKDDDVFPRRQKSLLVKQYHGKFPGSEKLKAEVAVLDRSELDRASDSSLTGEPMRKRLRKGVKGEANDKEKKVKSRSKVDGAKGQDKISECEPVLGKGKDDVLKDSKDPVQGKKRSKSTETKSLSRRQSRRKSIKRAEQMYEDKNDDSCAPFTDAMWTLAYYSPCNSDSGEMSPPRAWSPTVKDRIPLSKKKGKASKAKSKQPRGPRKVGSSPRSGDDEETNSLLSDLREVMCNVDKDTMMKEIENFEKIPAESFDANISDSIEKIDYIDSIIRDCSSTNSVDSGRSSPKGKSRKGKKKQTKGGSSTSGGPLLCTTPPTTTCAGIDQYRQAVTGSVPMDPMYMTSATTEPSQGYPGTKPAMPDQYRKPPPPYRPPRQGSSFEKFAGSAGFSEGSQYQQFPTPTTSTATDSTYQPQCGNFQSPEGAYAQQEYPRHRPEPLHMPVPQNNQVQYDLMSPPYVESDPNVAFGSQGNFSDLSQYRDKTHLAPTTPTPSVGQPSPNYNFNQQGIGNNYMQGHGEGYKYMGSQQQAVMPNNAPTQVSYTRSQSYNQSDMYTQGGGMMQSSKGYQQAGGYPAPAASRTLSRSMSDPYTSTMPMSYGNSYPTMAKPGVQQPLPSSVPDTSWQTQDVDASTNLKNEKGNKPKKKASTKKPKAEGTTKTKAATKSPKSPATKSTKAKKGKSASVVKESDKVSPNSSSFASVVKESDNVSPNSSSLSNTSDVTVDGGSRRSSSDMDTHFSLTPAQRGQNSRSPDVTSDSQQTFASHKTLTSPNLSFTQMNSSSGSENRASYTSSTHGSPDVFQTSCDSLRSPQESSMELSQRWNNSSSSALGKSSDAKSPDEGENQSGRSSQQSLKRAGSTESLSLRLETDSDDENDDSFEKKDRTGNKELISNTDGNDSSIVTPEKANGNALANGNSPSGENSSSPVEINNLPRSQDTTAYSERLDQSSFSLQPGQQPPEEPMEISPSLPTNNSQRGDKSGGSSSQEGTKSENNVCHNSVKIWTPLEMPPERDRIKENMTEHGLPQVRHKGAFYSNPDDLPEKASEVGGRQLKLSSVLPSELPDFESRLSLDGLRHWKTMLAAMEAVSGGSQERGSHFNVVGEMDKDPQLRAAFMGNQEVVITPCKDPPSRGKVSAWLKAKLKRRCHMSAGTLPGSRDDKDSVRNVHEAGNQEDAMKEETDLKIEDEQVGDKEEGDDSESTLKPQYDSTLSPESKQTTDDIDMISPSPEAKRQRSSPFLFGSHTHRQSQEKESPSQTGSRQKGFTPPMTPDVHRQSETESTTPKRDIGESDGPQHSTPTGPCRPTQLSLPKCTPILQKDSSAASASRPALSRIESARTKNLRRALLASQIKNQLVTPMARNVSDISQIKGPTPNNTYGFKVSLQNLQDAKALHEVQYLTTICMELHVRTRKDLCPDPEFDPIKALFFHIHSDFPISSGKKANITGVIIVDKDSAGEKAGENQPSTSKAAENVRGQRSLLHRSGVTDLEVHYVVDEKTLMEEFVSLIRKWDPDIFIGFEIEMLSWGYLLHRAVVLEYRLHQQLSRIPGIKKDIRHGGHKDDFGSEYASDISIVGRIVLNLWRLMRHELTLNIYTFENVAFHVLHQRFPRYSFRSLSDWFEHKTDLYRWRTIDYYVARVRGQQQILEQLDLIGQTSELARVFGIEFYHVLSRGSQYRVESMMLRIAKPMNFIASSPSVQQRARSKAPECLPLNMEPESSFYSDPVVVLDFQSLYPSMMIAYNYCFSTCLGRVKFLEEGGEIPLGCLSLNVPPGLLRKLQKKDGIHVSPNGIAFVKPKIRKGIIPTMLSDILKTRIMVKKSMKDNKDDKALHKLLHARQLGLKLIANVTYGYTSANFSGRMPCIEIGDSVVRKGRETLERGIELVRNTPKWNAEVVYGDTDSMFVLLRGRSKAEAFRIGREIAAEVTALNPKPVKLKFEKVYMPCVLQTKKRYVGYSYESEDQVEPDFDAKGIETVRRDNCQAVAKILERSLKLLFNARDVSQVKQFVQRQCQKLSEGRVSMQDLIFAKEYRGMGGYRPGACVPALEISKRLLAVDRRAEPRVGQRVPYVIVYGSPKLPLIQLVRRPEEVLQDSNLRLNATYYIIKQILPPLDRVFAMIGVNVSGWYSELPKVVRAPSFSAQTSLRKGTISQYFNTVNCPVCGEQTKESMCSGCQGNPQRVSVVLNTKVMEWEHTYQNLAKMCSNCCGTAEASVSCVSLDCPVLYRLAKAQRDMSKSDNLRQLLLRMLEF